MVIVEALRVLLLEDMPTDAELLEAELAAAGILANVHCVSDEQGFVDGLATDKPDIILSDFNVPGFDGLAALAMRNTSASDIPFLFVTGSLGEERAVETLRSGATDYVLKDRMARLPAAMMRALTERDEKKARARISGELEAERVLVRTILDTARALITVLDENGYVLHLNPAAEQVLGLPRDAVLGALFWDALVVPENAELARWQIRISSEQQSALPNRPWRATTPNGRVILWSVGHLTRAGSHGERLVLCGIDVTAQEKAEEKAYFLGHFDPVTGLPNRKLFQLRLENYCKGLHGASLVTMMVGLARVQEIRDSYGDAVINQILLETTQRLRAWPASHELLARVGDHTFALAFGVGQEQELTVLVPYILEQLRLPIQVEDKSWVLPAHAGVVLYPRDAPAADGLIQASESALHVAEGEAGSGYAFYTPLLSNEARERLQIESELRESLQSNDELILYYQPQVDLQTGRLNGLEALIRWRHPRLGLLGPTRFIAMAEVCGLMTQLGNWVMREACRQLKEWQAAGLNPPTVAVNLSASQFSAMELLQDIRTVLAEFGVLPGQIELELTESASMRDPQATIAIMSQLRQMGLQMAIDDFGTGYSNLSYLKRFPVNRLKLDQAFVRDITTDANDLAISRAVIAMSHQLRLEVIAEGVETMAQLQLLQEAGCDTVQGFLFSRPVPAEECAPLFAANFSTMFK
ncbi:putative bifunctional diguanylate cyclase/phosphodiesterase [Andreprevotia chitinilytica]|uniref:putative bifunctional diguanylate cyclase/phosphodiesterase n=1 Tax=Andreprevotia chitinilytica TaxID=396808 RepID=UPI000691C8C7|nr:EAL domain-containing protein [Andreprevotia chitinilytica]